MTAAIGTTRVAPGADCGTPRRGGLRSGRAAARQRKHSLAACLVCIALYAAGAAALIYLSRDQLNPDAVSYFQSARQYLAGRADLAVNSWFGPLLSWLLIPAAAVGLDLQIAAKIIAAVAGLGLAAGTSVLTRRMTGGRYGLAAFASGLLLALGMIPDPITPDILMACLITWYLVAASPSRDAGAAASPRRLLLAGVVGGIAYLAKAYAIPFVLAHLAMTVWLAGRERNTTPRRRQTEEKGDGPETDELGEPGTRTQTANGPPTASRPANRSSSWRSFLAPYLAGVLGLFLPAAPWIAVISAHDGVLTHSSAQRGVRAFSPVEASPLPMECLQRPRPGRISVWENPVECNRPWPHWSPFDGRRGLRLQLETIRINSAAAFQTLWRADLLGLLLASPLAIAGVCLWRRFRGPAPIPGPRSPVCLLPWACLSALLYLGGYAILFVQERFLWPVYGLLVAVCFCLLHQLLHRDGRLALVAAVVVAASMAWRPAWAIADWANPADGNRAGKYAFLRLVAAEMDAPDPAAANKWHEALAVCYWRGRPLLGKFQAGDANAIATELAPFGAANVLILWHEDLVRSLLEDARFTLAKRIRHAPTAHTATLLRYEGPPSGLHERKKP
jgi:hypothetical protein